MIYTYFLALALWVRTDLKAGCRQAAQGLVKELYFHNDGTLPKAFWVTSMMAFSCGTLEKRIFKVQEVSVPILDHGREARRRRRVEK